MKKKSIKSDLARVDRIKDTGIDYSDIPALDKSFLKKSTGSWPPVGAASPKRKAAAALENGRTSVK